MKNFITWQSLVFIVVISLLIAVTQILISVLTGMWTIPHRIGMTTIFLSLIVPQVVLGNTDTTLKRWMLRGVVVVLTSIICFFAAAGIFALSVGIQPLYFRLILIYVAIVPIALLALPLTIERNSPLGQAFYSHRRPIWKPLLLLVILVAVFAGLDAFLITYLPM